MSQPLPAWSPGKAIRAPRQEKERKAGGRGGRVSIGGRAGGAGGHGSPGRDDFAGTRAPPPPPPLPGVGLAWLALALLPFRAPPGSGLPKLYFLIFWFWLGLGGSGLVAFFCAPPGSGHGFASDRLVRASLGSGLSLAFDFLSARLRDLGQVLPMTLCARPLDLDYVFDLLLAPRV